VKSFLPNEAQPVPPIYQPEVAADAIAWVVEHPRRAMWVGWPTVATIVGDRVAPGFLERYIAWTGYRSQQTHEPRDERRPFNLYEPVGGDQGAHGAFDDRALDHSWQASVSKRRRGLLGLAYAGVVLMASVAATRGSHERRGRRRRRGR
jgi:hypothetical protein